MLTAGPGGQGPEASLKRQLPSGRELWQQPGGWASVSEGLRRCVLPRQGTTQGSPASSH